MKDMEKKIIKVGLDILSNNPRYVITNVENDSVDAQNLIEQGEKFLEGEDIDNIDISPEELEKILNLIQGIKGVNNDRRK